MKSNENKALAILFANTERKNRTADLVSIAKSCEYLKRRYGSIKAVADKIGLHPEMIREFLSVLSLHPKARQLVRNRIIDKLDTVYRISKLTPSLQVKAIKELTNLRTEETRDIHRLMQQKKVSLQKAKRKIIDSKLKGLNVFIIDFDDDIYKAIREQAKRRMVKPIKLIKVIVLNWLKKQK
ncbi:MAG: hypothetical protein QME51_06125 [Planctomycetota bacterium]|nr:hypothetical protein [Planctomycetota bacterium]